MLTYVPVVAIFRTKILISVILIIDPTDKIHHACNYSYNLFSTNEFYQGKSVRYLVIQPIKVYHAYRKLLWPVKYPKT